MVRNHVRLILIQVAILIGRSQGQRLKNNDGTPTTVPRTKPLNPSASGYYPPYGAAYPYQYPGYGCPQYAYPSQPAGGTSYPRPSPLVRPPNGSWPLGGFHPLQQFYLGPMNAAQASYLIAYVQSLMRYGNNTITPPQIPPTPPQNASSVQPSTPVLTTSSEPTPTPDSTISSFEESSSLTQNESSQPSTSTPIPPEFSTPDERQSTPPMSVPEIISALLPNDTGKSVNNSVDQSITALLSPVSEPGDGPIVRSAQDRCGNPFAPNSAYPAGSDWLYSYNPAVTSFYGNLPPSQPFYPRGFGPHNPFVLGPPATLPASQPNATEPSAQNCQVNTPETATTDTAGEEGGPVTRVEDLPPQVKEFIKMIPDILSMPETSQLSPSNNNAVIHRIVGGLNGAEMEVRQFGGGPASITPAAPKSYDDIKSLQRFKKRRMKSLRRPGNNCYSYYKK